VARPDRLYRRWPLPRRSNRSSLGGRCCALPAVGGRPSGRRARLLAVRDGSLLFGWAAAAGARERRTTVWRYRPTIAEEVAHRPVAELDAAAIESLRERLDVADRALPRSSQRSPASTTNDKRCIMLGCLMTDPLATPAQRADLSSADPATTRLVGR